MNNSAINSKKQASDKKSVLSMGVPSVLITALIWFLAYQSPFLNNIAMINNSNINSISTNPIHYNGVPDAETKSSSSGMEIVLSNADRLAFGIKCLFIASLVFPIIIQRMAVKRLNSEAINPLLLEERALSSNISNQIDQQVKMDFLYLGTMQRILQNTIEQFILFSMNILILSLYLSPKDFKILVFATITFIVMRIAFWIGYLRHYVMRAIGFSCGMMMNIVLAITGLYLMISTDILPHIL